jgi:hypothetical protein
MKNLRTTLQNTFSAAAFAEQGEHETALELVGRPAEPRRSWLDVLRRTFAAVAFAEAGLPEVAVAMSGQTPVERAPQPSLQDFMRQVGLQGVPVYYGVARM